MTLSRLEHRHRRSLVGVLEYDGDDHEIAASADPCLAGDDAPHARSHCPIQFTFLDHAFMGLVGAFDPVLELVVFDRHKLRDLINPNRAMPASDPQKLLLAAVFGARNFFGWTRIIQGHPVYIA